MTEARHSLGRGKPAVFFDVDGTLVATTIVHYYIYFRRRRMSSFWGGIWSTLYLLKCAYYLVLDKISRSYLNVVFYRSYGGLEVGKIKALVPDCHRDVIKPRRFRQAADCIADHRAAGRRIVLVTGSIDFIVEPLAGELAVDDVLAPALIESDGRFTGALDGPPIGEVEKARRVRRFAEESDIDLTQCYAYGDSIADLPMLEAVGHPNTVNPDRALGAVARSRGWPTHRWTVVGPPQSKKR